MTGGMHYEEKKILQSEFPCQAYKLYPPAGQLSVQPLYTAVLISWSCWSPNSPDFLYN